jgi:diguanylate cyclase (GGDEF)-like protein
LLRIQHLQWMGIAAAAVGCLLLGGSVIYSSVNNYQARSQAVVQLENFSLLLDAANAISAERGPANSALSSDDPALLQPLLDLRARVDNSIATIETAFDDLLKDEECGTAFVRVLEALEHGRNLVDATIAIPLAERRPERVAAAIMSMFAAADRSAELRDRITAHILHASPALAGEIMLANSASSLRDQEGRFGSYLVMALISPSDVDDAYLEGLRTTHGIISSIWNTNISLADNVLVDTPVVELVAAVQKDYFETALPWALAVASGLPARQVTAVEFTASYVEAMRSSERLRGAIVEQSIEIQREEASRSLRHLLGSSMLTLGTLIVLVLVTVIFRRTLFSPLMRLHDDVVALAGGDLREPQVLYGVAREVNTIVGGLSVLRQNLTEKKLLEEEQGRLTRRLRRQAETDPLTGLLNRRALLARVDAMFRRSDRIGETLAVALFDIDHFKQINDTHGHAVGDEVLAGVARAVREQLGAGDTLARIGGEEFVLVLRRSDETRAVKLLETIRILLTETSVQETLGLKVTASFGMALRPAGSGMSWDDLFTVVDESLYIAKNTGRNRIVIHGDATDRLRRA